MVFSIEPRHQIYVKGYRFLSFAMNMGKSVSKNLAGNYSQNLLRIFITLKKTINYSRTYVYIKCDE